MKLIKILTIGLSILLVISCSKSEAEDKTEAPDGSESAAVALPTLQCGMCKKIIEKGLTDIEGVVCSYDRRSKFYAESDRGTYPANSCSTYVTGDGRPNRFGMG